MKNYKLLAAAAAALLLACIPPASARTEKLVSIETGSVAPLQAEGGVRRVLTVNGQLVALGAHMWVYDESRNDWTNTGIFASGPVMALSAGDGQRSFLLSGSCTDGILRRVEEVALQPTATRTLPRPPVALTSARAGLSGSTLYVAGYADGKSQLLSIDTAAPTLQWTTRAGWPDSNGRVTSVVAQTFAVYVTVEGAAGSGDKLFRWKADESWTPKGEVSGTVIDDAARPIGQAHVLYLVRPLGADEATRSLKTFHTITSSWATLDDPGATGAVSATPWKNGMLWMRARPGERAVAYAGCGNASANAGADAASSNAGEGAASSGTGANASSTSFSFAQLQSGKLLLQPIDWIVLVVYLGSMIGMGLYFYLREKRNSTADFFVGGRTIPFWAAGVSLYATNTSSISYIAIPAKAFETNWQYLTNNLVAVLGLMFVAVWIVPLLRRLDLMSVFQYLETRFHPVIRTLASALCILVQIGSRMSVILFLPSLAIATITGIDVVYSIVIMGVFTMIYTALGGMKAVIWTDFVQLFVKMGGILFAIGFVVLMLNGGTGELVSIAAAENKTKLFDFSWDLTKATVWGFIFLVLFDVVLTFPKDQVLMQRVLSTESAKDASRSVWMFAAIMIPGGFMFYMVGTALFAFYKTHPERMDPLLPIDATFPLFIAAELPMGVKGLIIAGIFAAAMATLSSIMNSVATLASVDFYEKLVKNPNPKTSVRFAEVMTVVTGFVGIGLALLLSRYNIHSLFDVSIELAGLLGGGFAGAYTLGMFTRRANWQGVTIGIVVSITLTLVAWSMNLVHPYFYLAISIMVCIIVGYLASWLFPPPKSVAGLTIYEKKPQPQGVAAERLQTTD